MSSIFGWLNDMRIRRIEIQNFKKLIGPIVIDNIADGITVLAGDNEEGKSTVLQALRTALFDRHNLTGDAADAMQPFGHKVRPEIGLVFEVDGSTYRLKKGYCQKPSAELITPTGTFAGLAAEEKLQQLLRFHPPGKGQGKPDQHHGIFGLFWVEQGRAFSPISLSTDNRTALMGALEGEVGQVLGGSRGRALKDTIGAQYRSYFTDTGRPRNQFAEAISTVDRLQGEVAPLKAQLSQYETKVDELARTRERLALYAREGRLARAQSELDQAQAKVAHISILDAAVRDAANGKTLADAGVQGPTAHLKGRDDAIARETKDADALVAASEESNAADKELTEKSSEFASRVHELQTAEGRLEATTNHLRAIEQQVERVRLDRDKARLAHAFNEARAADELARNARATATAIKVDVAAVRRLRSLSQKLSEADAALAGSSTLIQFHLENAGVVLVGGSPAPQNGDLSITDPTTFEIVNAGTLTVIPGGEELSARRTAAESARTLFRDALHQVSAETLAQAETLAEQRQQHLTDADTQAQIVKAHAPDGIDELAVQLSNTQAFIDGLPEMEMVVSDTDRASAQTAHRDAEEKMKSARQRRDGCQKELTKAQQGHVRAQATLESAQKAAAESALELSRARALATDASLRQAVADAISRVSKAEAVLEATQHTLTAADPEASQLAFERARDGLKAIRDDIDSLTLTDERSASELRGMGQQGLGEIVQDLDGRLLLATAQRDRLSREAATLKLLNDTLGRAEQQARETFLAPVQTRVQPYLRLLLPETELVLSDSNLGVTHLRRNGQDEPFDSLSIGAREQVAVLTRLAFADLLRERGITAPVVLDDALVNSDPHRFERMLLAIRRAAKNLQIIVLTCDEANWVQAGAPMIRLAACNRS